MIILLRILTIKLKKEILVEYASMFDMHCLITFEDRIILLKKLHTLFGTNYIHDVNELKYRWKEFKISIFYSRKLRGPSKGMEFYSLPGCPI